ncbi:MAG: AGE family epimerase/isomerase [Alphaproteobacteria bacterium]|nr:AGE family epimerase/isomerase [Alphaproteobacteria bacterium]
MGFFGRADGAKESRFRAALVMGISPIILCGGEGSRLWPVSRRDFPKQFARLVGKASCFQQAVLRFYKVSGAGTPVIVAGETHEAVIRAQLEEIGVEAIVLLEPEGRDSAPATAAAAAYLLSAGQDGPAIMQPADHHIPDVALFRTAAIRAAEGADSGLIVTFGIAPNGPDTSYGYISSGQQVNGCAAIHAVRRFIEKPSRENAIEYLAQGFLWNSGMFAFRPSVLLGEMRAFEPAIADAVERAVANGARDGNVVRLDPFAFGQSPKKSLDYAVMERTKRAAVVSGDFPWSDLGAWSAIYGAHDKDVHGNVVSGDHAIAVQSERCFIRTADIPLAVIGLSDVGVIAEPDGIIVCKLDASPSVKIAVETLRSRARPEALRRTKMAERPRDYPDLKSAAERLCRWLDNSALPLWWTAGADHTRGGFFELLDEQARAVPSARRIRVQARQTYVYATAGLTGWAGPWRTAVVHGLNALAGQYRRPDGLYRTQVDDNGASLDERAFLYDQAFVLLALATAAKAGVEARRCTADAVELRTILLDRFARPNGGFREEAMRGSTFQSNPHMHFLEAALAWREASDDPEWEALAESIVRVCLDHFVDAESGMLREFFDETGSPFDGLPGSIIEPGHQFEWAWLLSRWAQIRRDDAAAGAASRLFEIGERYGVDPIRGVAIDVLLADMSPHSRQARLWPQTERLKGALALAARAANKEQTAAFERTALLAAEGLSHYLHTSVPGLWHDKMRADGTFVIEPSPASSLYHIACATDMLRKHAGC